MAMTQRKIKLQTNGAEPEGYGDDGDDVEDDDGVVHVDVYVDAVVNML